MFRIINKIAAVALTAILFGGIAVSPTSGQDRVKAGALTCDISAASADYRISEQVSCLSPHRPGRASLFWHHQ